MAEAANWLIFVLGEEFEDERWEILQRTARIDPLLPDLNRALAWGYAERGNFAQAERTFQRLLAAPQPAQLTYHDARDFHAGIGQFVESVEISKRLVLDTALSSRRAFGINHLAESYAWLGMWDSASYWLSRKEPDWFDAKILERQGRYQDILELWDQLREREGITLADQDPGWVGYYGHTQALAGAWQEAIRTLEPVVEVDPTGDVVWGGAREALVYAYRKTGAGAKAEPFLAAMGKEWQEWEARGLLHYGPELVDYALFTLLSGDQDGAIELLQKAFDAGWRGYYWIVNDPRWDSLRADPRFQALMAAVREHVDAQRVEMERIDAKENFGVGVDL